MNLNQDIINTVSKIIPHNIKIADYLMDKLELRKDSVYRRIRGEIPFSFNEIVKLSIELNFSVDEIIGKKEERLASFKIQPNILLNPEQTFTVMLEHYYNNLNIEFRSQNVEVYVTGNHVLTPFTLYYDNLFKFSYFKWAYQRYDLNLNVKYNEITVPDEVIQLCHQIRRFSQGNNVNYTYIMDKNVFLNTAEQIEYYYKRKLISLDELLLLKEDMLSMIKATEKLARNGSERQGVNYYYYLSSINIESNTVYIRYDNVPKSYFWIYSVSPIATNHEIFCATHKKWIDSIKKYSVLISQSNDILLAEFFNKQYAQIESMFSS